MKALVITRHGNPEVLAVQDLPDPRPGAGELLLSVARAGLNFADVAARQGLYPDAPPLPTVMGYEVAGTVLEVAPDVTGFRVGDRVGATTRFRGQADRVAVPAGQAFKLPDHVTFDAAAAVPVNYLTAYHMLHTVARMRPGAKVLVHMAAGGVGLAVVALCRQVQGVELFGTASASKHATLREAGVAHPIDYRTEDYVAQVRSLTKGRGVDLVLDALGGKDWRRGYELLAPAGHLICCGWSNMTRGGRRNIFHVLAELLRMPRFSPMALTSDNRTVSGVNLGRLWDEETLLQGPMQQLVAQLGDGRIRPRVDRVFPLSAGAEAHRYLQERRNMGKVLFDCTS